MGAKFCYLCGQAIELVSGHIWPAFAYRRYVSDVSQGGRFVDLSKNVKHSKQLQRSWFCGACDAEVIGKTENYVAAWCDRLADDPTSAKTYDHRMLSFATSISLRTVMYEIERLGLPIRPTASEAMARWKDFLRGRRRDIRPYSQHLFVVYGHEEIKWHHALGGQIYKEFGLVLSQVGPLFIVGLLRRVGLTLRDLRVWAHSEIKLGSGSVAPVSEWRVGETITLDCMQMLLANHQHRMMRIVEVGADGNL